nr:HD domain-containing protein [Bdellovibrionales bacterium]
VQRLINREVSSIHISRDQLPAFYKFSASQLKNLALNPAIGEAERRERMHQAVRSLLTCFLTDDTDMQDCAQIVKTYVTGSPDDGSSWYDKMMRLSGNHSGDAYSHVSNVSTLASMFAIGLGLTTVEEVALGGLLHEVGLADIPANIQMKKKRSNFEQAEYERHPMIGAEILRSRKITIPDLTLKIIEQHRERVDATGYPNRLNEVLVEAQLVAIADEYDEGTQVVPGQPRKSARAVMEEILKHPGFSAEVRARIADLLGFAKAPTDESAA